MDKILLFIPMYNCEKQIVRVLDQLTPHVCELLSEVIIVNNRSTDNRLIRVILRPLRDNSRWLIPHCPLRLRIFRPNGHRTRCWTC